MEENQKTSSPDHDLLIEIKTELKLFREESRNIDNDTRNRLIKLGENKLEKETFQTFLNTDTKIKSDHEARLRFMERYLWLAVGATDVVILVIGWYLIVHYNNR